MRGWQGAFHGTSKLCISVGEVKECGHSFCGFRGAPYAFPAPETQWQCVELAPNERRSGAHPLSVPLDRGRGRTMQETATRSAGQDLGATWTV